MRRFDVKKYEASDFDRVRELYSDAKKRARTRNYDFWRLHSSPLGDSPTVLAISGSKCVGLYTMWPIELLIKGKPTKATQSMDTLTHQDFRGQGIFITLADECYKLCEESGFELMYGFPNANSYPGFVRYLNWDHVGDIIVFRKVRNLSRFFEISSKHTHTFSSLPAADEYQNLVEKYLNQGTGICVHRGKQWLEWRYSSSSETTYYTTVYQSINTIKAMVIMAQKNQNWGDFAREQGATVVEMFGEDVESLTEALNTATSEAFKRGLTSIKAYSTHEIHKQALYRAGLKSFDTIPFITRKTTTRSLPENPHVFQNWNLQGGDWDTF